MPVIDDGKATNWGAAFLVCLVPFGVTLFLFGMSALPKLGDRHPSPVYGILGWGAIISIVLDALLIWLGVAHDMKLRRKSRSV